MPKCISRKDSKQVYCAFKVCEKANRVSVFSEPVKMSCQIVNMSGTRTIEYAGQTITYNAVALFNVDENSKYIDVATKFWVKTRPNDTNNDYADYEVTGKTPPTDGLIKVFLMSCKQNNREIYVAFQGNVCSLAINFDKENKTAVLPKDYFFPFTPADVFWERKPSSFTDRTNTMFISSITKGDNGIIVQFEEKV